MKLSILIRNLNEATALDVCLKSIAAQKVSFDYEVVVIDNESDDNSLEIIKKHNAKAFIYPRKAFTYGSSINFGMEKCQGEFTLILSPHVYLLNDNFLQNIPIHFEDKSVAGLRFTNSLSQDLLKGAFFNSERIMNWQSENGNVKTIWQYTTVNHCAAIRRTNWEQNKYNEQVCSGEDKIWAYQVMKSGYSVKINIPSFYAYHRSLSKKALIKKRAQEEVAYMLAVGAPYKEYPRTIDKKTYFIYTQIWAAYQHIKTHINVTRLVKKMYKTEKPHFDINSYTPQPQVVKAEDKQPKKLLVAAF